MYNTTINSINLTGLDFFDSAVDFSDLAFFELIVSMSETDKALSAKMKEIRRLNEIKKRCTKQIEILNQWLDRSDSITDGTHKQDVVYVPGGLDDPADPSDSDCLSLQEQKQLEKNCKDLLGRGLTDQETLHDNDVYLRTEVDHRIERLRDKLEELNSSSSVLMIDLQRIMNKRNEAMQLVSNLEAKSHQTASAIIANFK